MLPSFTSIVIPSAASLPAAGRESLFSGVTVNLQLTEDQQLLQKTVREFAQAEVKPRARELDETGRFPRDLFAKAAELGLTGVAIPENQGGAWTIPGLCDVST